MKLVPDGAEAVVQHGKQSRALLACIIVLCCLLVLMTVPLLVAMMKPSQNQSPTKPAVPQNQSALVELDGVVVDDQTEQPIEDYGLEWGMASAQDPSEIRWGYGLTTSSRRPQGRFRERRSFQQGARVWLRVLAPGYLPQPVTPEPLVAPVQITNLVVRLNRGAALHGVVSNAAGDPVAGAKIFLVGTQSLRLEEGFEQMFKGTTAVTDAGGRFVLSGVGTPSQRVAVSVNGRQLAVANVPDVFTSELSIRLPEPATLLVR
jgi:hypothetical protein